MLSFGSSFFSPLAAAGNFAISKEGFFLFFFWVPKKRVLWDTETVSCILEKSSSWMLGDGWYLTAEKERLA